MWRAGLVAGLCLAMAFLWGCFLLPNDPPVASFTATPTAGGTSLAVSFDASGSYDPDGSLVSYRWTFGDGVEGYGVFVDHVYAAPGTYTVELTVKDLRQATSSASEQIEVRKITKYAIIVGVASYPPPQVSLTYTDDDASALRDRLLSLPDWDADHVVLLLNQQATSSNFRAVLDSLTAADAGGDDLLVVYFSGHGNYYRDLSGDEVDEYDEALLFYDYTNPMLDDTLALLLEQVPVRRLAVFIDACYSGGQLDSRAGQIAGRRGSVRDEGFIEDLARVGSRSPKDLDRVAKDLVGITASRFDEVSWEVASLRHGLFTYALLEALDGRADATGDGDGQTSAEECYAYLLPRVEFLARTLVEEPQVPQMLDHATGELEIAAVP